MKISELLVEQQETDEGFGKHLAGAALAGAMALGSAGAAAKADTQPGYQNDPINAMVQQKETERLSAIDRAKIQDILKIMQADKDTELAQSKVQAPPMALAALADPTKNLKPGSAAPAKPVAKPVAAHAVYKPITGRPAETALHNFAVKVGLKGNELAAFMGQSAHESDGFKTAEEYASGDAYEGRKDLGNIYKGDGRKYKGRGFIQITGRYNYTAAGKALGLDLVNHPELVEKPVNAAKVTWWYWKNKVRPNVGNFDNTKAITKKIQGGSLGLQSREKYTQSFKSAQK